MTSRKSPRVDEVQQELLRTVARKRATTIEPQRIGSSFFFEVNKGWEVRVLADDPNVRKVYTVLGLEDAFNDRTVRTILIPRDSSVDKTMAMRVCGQQEKGKTVFFEISHKDND